MTWEVLAKPYYSDSELTDKTIFQPMKFNRNAVLRAVRVWVVIEGGPVFTSLNMKIYANDENAETPQPSSLIHSSTNDQLKAAIHSEPYACKEIYFEFNDPSLRANTWYHFVLNADGYSEASHLSHVAWRVAYPDPQYPAGVTLDRIKAAQYPLTLYPIFARFDKQ